MEPRSIWLRCATRRRYSIFWRSPNPCGRRCEWQRAGMHLWSMSIAIPKIKAIAGGIEGDAVVAKARENAEAAFCWISKSYLFC
ncbi:MAG: hypothetical protein ABFD45_01525 [Smithella sp.]